MKIEIMPLKNSKYVDALFNHEELSKKVCMGEDKKFVSDYYKESATIAMFMDDIFCGVCSMDFATNHALVVHPILLPSLNISEKRKVCAEAIDFVYEHSTVDSMLIYTPTSYKENIYFARLLGFRYVAELKNFYKIDGVAVDGVIYRNGRDQWEDRRRQK